MSWSEPTSRRALLAAASSLLAACGFTPLYGPGTPAAEMLGRVEVGPLEGAPGFALREELTGRLGPATAPTHRLDVELELEEAGVALTQQDITTRFDVIGTATYTLVPLAGGPPVAAGVVRSVTGYSAPESETASAFASRVAGQDAERRLAVDLADQIVQRLALSAGRWV
jgi:LPS-assembly lipoprotein